MFSNSTKGLMTKVNFSGHNNYSTTPEQFKTISLSQNDLELGIKERLLMMDLKPNLNNVNSCSWAVFKYIILHFLDF